MINASSLGRIGQPEVNKRRRTNENAATFGPLSNFHMLVANSSLHHELVRTRPYLVLRLRVRVPKDSGMLSSFTSINIFGIDLD